MISNKINPGLDVTIIVTVGEDEQLIDDCKGVDTAIAICMWSFHREMSKFLLSL